MAKYLLRDKAPPEHLAARQQIYLGGTVGEARYVTEPNATMFSPKEAISALDWVRGATGRPWEVVPVDETE